MKALNTSTMPSPESLSIQSPTRHISISQHGVEVVFDHWAWNLSQQEYLNFTLRALAVLHEHINRPQHSSCQTTLHMPWDCARARMNEKQLKSLLLLLARGLSALNSEQRNVLAQCCFNRLEQNRYTLPESGPKT